MGFKEIKSELLNDPLDRGYTGMTTAEKLASLVGAKDRGSKKAFVSGDEVLNLTDSTEYSALSDTKKQQWLSFCGIEQMNPFGPAVAVAQDIIGAGPTIAALAAFRNNPDTSRAEELQLGNLSVQVIETALGGSW